MKKAIFIATVLCFGLALAPWMASAQVVTAQPTDATSAAPAIPSDQQPSREQLEKLFELMRVRQQVQSVLKMIPAMAQQQMEAQASDVARKHPECNLSKPENQAAFNKVMSKFMDKAFNIVTIDEMLDDVTVVYQRHISRADVDALIAFYNSPAGQHLLDAQPVMMQEYMPMVMKRAQERSAVLVDGLSRDLEQLVKSTALTADKPVAK